MLKITFSDGSQKDFVLKSVDREQAFYNVWHWFLKHGPDKKLLIRINDFDSYTFTVEDIKQVEIC